MTDHEGTVRLDIESLRVFRELVAADGFTAAAQRLGVTQSAVSHKIRRLEERIGVALLRRAGQQFVLTTDGRELLAHAVEIVAAHDAAVDALQRSAVAGKVRLGCNEEVAATALTEVAERFGRTHPDVSLAIRVHDSAFVAEWLDAGEIDVALIQVLDTPGALRHDDEVWRRDELFVVQAAHADFDTHCDVPLISFGERCLYEPFFGSAMHAAGRAYHQVMECPSIQGVQSAVTAGLGVAVLNTPNITDDMRLWCGADLGLPSVAFVLRQAAESGNAVDALCSHLTSALAGTCS
jgi:DNA-binding transcriptional LysR family regulator